MSPLRLLCITCLLLASPACLGWGANFALRPSDEAAVQFRDMLEARQFAELDRIAQDQPGTATVADGTMRLDALLRGMFCHGLCNTTPTPEQRDERVNLFREWQKARPQSQLARHLMVHVAEDEAWRARGSGFAATVTPEGWREFRKNIDRAWRLNESQASWGRNHPLWHRTRLYLLNARGASTSTFEAAYLDAVKRFPLYLSLHFAGANYYSKRWHGSDAEMSAFIERAVQMTNKPLGPTLYARINWAEQSEDMFTSGRADWEQVRSGFLRLVKDYPALWNINKFAAFACFNSDFAYAAPLMKRLDDLPMPDAWNLERGGYTRCKEAVAKLEPKDYATLPF